MIFGICYLWLLFVNAANANLLYENTSQVQKTAVFLVSSFFLLFLPLPAYIPVLKFVSLVFVSLKFS